MEYRRLGNSGLIVSALSLGTMQFGQLWQVGQLDQAATTEMVKFALDRGINFIDTADVYSRGESEQYIGGAIKALGVRQQTVIATKARLPMSDTDFNHSGATRHNIMREVDDSLRRLDTDYIDLYQMHGWDSNTPLEETLRALDDIVRAGKVRYIGFSNYLAWHGMAALALQAQLSLHKYVTAQMYYSLVERTLEHEFVSFCEYTGVGILVWSALAGGFLSGKYERGVLPPEATRFRESGPFVPFDADLDRSYAIVDAVKAVAARHEVSASRVALAWTVRQPMVSSVIIAARKLEHLEDNIAAIDLKLTAEDVAELDAVSHPGTPYPKWMHLQLNVAEDPRSQILHPERYTDGGAWKDLRQGTARWKIEK
ncbi:MAG: aldo/keto reductase [Chloroflexota bacterium]|nr:aldo/keto reductase [Chloroflexota bacterium]